MKACQNPLEIARCNWRVFDQPFLMAIAQSFGMDDLFR